MCFRVFLQLFTQLPTSSHFVLFGVHWWLQVHTVLRTIQYFIVFSFLSSHHSLTQSSISSLHERCPVVSLLLQASVSNSFIIYFARIRVLIQSFPLVYPTVNYSKFTLVKTQISRVYCQESSHPFSVKRSKHPRL